MFAVEHSVNDLSVWVNCGQEFFELFLQLFYKFEHRHVEMTKALI